MPSYGRFYVLGPPVIGPSDVAGLVEYVMRRTSDMRAAVFSVHDVEGPVRFDSSWIPGGRTQEVRHGLRVADLWTGLVLQIQASIRREACFAFFLGSGTQTCTWKRSLFIRAFRIRASLRDHRC